MTFVFGGNLRLLRSIGRYKSETRRRFPAIPNYCLDTWPLLETDVVAVHAFLDVLDVDTIVLDVGTFLGLSSFALSLHPRVVRVVSVDPNPRLADELAKEAVVGQRESFGDLGDVRVLDIARDVLAAFPEQAHKIDVLEGAITRDGNPSEPLKLDEFLGDGQLLAVIDGLHTADAVAGDLKAVFSARPDAVAVLDDCRYVWGLDVQSGIARFLAESEARYRFRLLVDVSSAFAKSNLGFVYSADAGRGEEAFATFERLFYDFDPLALFARNEELLRLSAQQREELTAAQQALAGIQASRSWRITSPLRWVDAALGRQDS